MITFIPGDTQKLNIILSLLILSAISCKKLPEANFTYEPTQNAEAGDTIYFINSSVEASSYEWEFGDNGTSSLEEPFHIYEQAGTYEVKLTAINEDGTASKTEAVSINEPTVLAFFVFDSAQAALAGAEVLLYDNEFDFENFNQPLWAGFTDFDGLIAFFNVEPVTHYLWIFRLEEEGFWGAGGSTGPITGNMVNLFEVTCEWFEVPADTTGSGKKSVEARGRNIKVQEQFNRITQ